MSTSLPERPDLDQLRRQAKELRDAARFGDPLAAERVARQHPSAQASELSLAVAQLVVARELGFSSWPTLKAAVEARTGPPAVVARQLVAASVEGRLQEAVALLATDPTVAGRSLRAAVVLGEADAVRAFLLADPEAAVAVDDERGWPPLLYACYSPWHRIDRDRAARLAEVVRLLLAAGASPNTNNGAFRAGYRSAVRGAVEVNNPDVVHVLLDAGANPDDGRCIEQAADRRDPRCLQLLLAHGARVAGTWALGAAVYAGDPIGVTLLLDALRTSKGETAGEATRALADAAAANASSPVVAALLAAGADPNVHDSDVGRSALRCAVRAGDTETAAMLVGHGATDDSTDIDQFIGACLGGDRQHAELILTDHPDLHERLTVEDWGAVVDAASWRQGETVALMLDLGFSPHARHGGEQALHRAAYSGNASAVRVLLDAGADVDGRDDRFEATPLAFATVGSGEQAGKPGDWVSTVRVLIEAGASRDAVWISDKPPSEDVAAVLRGYGVTPDEADEEMPRGGGLTPGEPVAGQVLRGGVTPGEAVAGQDVADPASISGSIGAGVMAEVAGHLEAAYRDDDLDLLASLLHPDVTWTGLCHNRAQVIDWFRGFRAEGTVAMVEGVEVDRDAVVLSLSVSRRAEGARPAPPQRLYQVATVDGGEIVDIRFYPDRDSALRRSR